MSLLLLFNQSATAAWYNASWQHRRKITLDNAAQAETLTNFPVLVKLDSTRITYADCKAAGADLRFTASDGTTLLDYEIETWNTSGTSYVWVRVPSIAASTTTDIYVYYGNSGASDAQNANGVWRTEYKAVYHLTESGDGSTDEFKDSTGAGNHGKGGNGTAGKIPTRTTSNSPPTGYAQVFDGGDYILFKSPSGVYTSGNISVGGWVRRTGTSPSCAEFTVPSGFSQ